MLSVHEKVLSICDKILFKYSVTKLFLFSLINVTVRAWVALLGIGFIKQDGVLGGWYISLTPSPWTTLKILFRMSIVDPCVSSISNSAYLSLNTHFKRHCSTVLKSKHPF